MTNKNKELQDQVKGKVKPCVEHVTEEYVTILESSLEEYANNLIQETKDSMGSIQSQLVEAYKKGRADEAKDKPLLDEFSRDMGTQPPKAEPVDVLIDDYQEWEDGSFEGSCGYCGNRLYSHSAYLSCDECNTKAKWPLSQSPHQTKE